MSRGNHKPNVRAQFAIYDEVNDPMNLRNNVVPRAFIKASVMCAVLNKDAVLHIEERAGFLAGDYAQQAHNKYGKCRVLFFQPGEDRVWREIRWKNANVGALYKRPAFVNVALEKVPPELQVAVMCAS